MIFKEQKVMKELVKYLSTLEKFLEPLYDGTP
jgi:hypothetical protein